MEDKILDIVKEIKTRKTNHMTALRNYQAGSEESTILKARISECIQIIGIINDLNIADIMPHIREYSPEFDEVECHYYELEQVSEDNTETCHLGLEIECCNHCYMNKSLYGS